MSDFSVRSDSVNVEQIMEQIRARIREKRGVDYTEQQIRELATVKLEKFLDPRAVRSDLLQQFQRTQASQTGAANITFGPNALFDARRPMIAKIRAWLRPVLRLFFNPDPLSQALLRLNEIDPRTDMYYELFHNLVIELTRTSIEVKNLKMRIESLTGRLEFNERRARALESVVAYKPSTEDSTSTAVGTQASIGRGTGDGAAASGSGRHAGPYASRSNPPANSRQASRGSQGTRGSQGSWGPQGAQSQASHSTQPETSVGSQGVAAAAAAQEGSPASPEPPVSPSTGERVAPPAEGPGQRSRRRRRRRGRRGGGSAAAVMAGAPPVPSDASAGASGADEGADADNPPAAETIGEAISFEVTPSESHGPSSPAAAVEPPATEPDRSGESDPSGEQ
jgi:hypothetical protein